MTTNFRLLTFNTKHNMEYQRRESACGRFFNSLSLRTLVDVDSSPLPPSLPAPKEHVQLMLSGDKEQSGLICRAR